jgi:hypothetical protein
MPMRTGTQIPRREWRWSYGAIVAIDPAAVLANLEMLEAEGLACLEAMQLVGHGHPLATGEYRSAALGRCHHALAEVGGRL